MTDMRYGTGAEKRIHIRGTWNNMSTERQLRQTIDEQEKEICRLQDQNNKLIEINDAIWSMFREQSRKLNRLESERSMK